METRDGRIFLVRTSSAENNEREEELNWESSSKKKKKKKKKRKTAKKSHDRVLKEILNYYKNNPANQKMFSASKARRNKLKSLAGKKLKFNRLKPPGILSNM